MRFAKLALPALAGLATGLCTPGLAAQTVLNVDQYLGMDDGEITPDGKYGVVRMNGFEGQMRVYDMADGALIEEYDCANGLPFFLSGDNQDGVAVTNERAVLVGNCTVVADLTATGTPSFVLAHHDTGYWGRDVEVTPDGSMAAIRGGSTVPAQGGAPAYTGGLYLIDVATGAMLASAPGEPSSSAPLHALDTVAVSDTHAVFLSEGPGSTGNAPKTRVTVFELRPAGGGPPAIVFETVDSPTLSNRDFDGFASDIAISPDGSHVAIRAEFEVGLISLAGPGTALVWRKVPSGNPGSLGAATLDTLVITNDRVATLGRWSNGGVGAQLDLFDYAGNGQRHRFVGDPHDLTVTPTTNRLLTRTHQNVLLFDLGVNLTVPGSLKPLDEGAGNGSHTSWGAGLDSIEATDERAVALFRNQDVTLVEIFDISQDLVDPIASLQMPEPPIDLMITPDRSRVVLAGNSYVQVIDLRTNAITMGADVVFGVTQAYVPWCDGVVVNDTHALAFGYDTCFQCGWVAVVDLFSDPLSYCSAGVNSTGAAAAIFPSGSASVAANDLTLWSSELPASKVAAVIYGDGQQQTPFGLGNACVAGTTYRFPLRKVQADGTLSQVVDVTGPARLGGAITAGTSWNFQLLYRDAGNTNATDGLSVTFVP